MEGRPGPLRGRAFCSMCGSSEVRRHGLAPMGWEEMPEANGRVLSLCPDCVRKNLWVIEAGLEIDPETGFQ